MELQELLTSLETNNKVQVLHGLDAYTMPMMLRIQQRPKLIKQLINQEKVPFFHNLTGQLVKDLIAKRVEFGIGIKNLLTYCEPVKDIEKTNPATLKETRMLPESFHFDLILSVFNDIVTVTKLDTENCIGYIIKDAVIAQSFDALFEMLWEQGQVA